MILGPATRVWPAETFRSPSALKNEQLRSPLSDCLRLETGQNTCKLERESRRGTGDPSAGFPLRCVGTRALAVRAEKTLAGEIVEGARDHRHGQQSFGRDGARDPVMGKRDQRRSHRQHDWAFRGVVASAYFRGAAAWADRLLKLHALDN